jgi:hypothetical protein
VVFRRQFPEGLSDGFKFIQRGDGGGELDDCRRSTRQP